MECLKKNNIKKSAKNKKLHFLGFGKRPKNTILNEVKSNLKKKKNYRWDVCNQSCIIFFSHLKHKKIVKICFTIIFGFKKNSLGFGFDQN